jgi:hypothetical protein
METARTSETLVNFYQTTQRYNSEDGHLRYLDSVSLYFVQFTPRVNVLKIKVINHNVLQILGHLTTVFHFF